MITVKCEDLSAAFDFVSFASPMEHHAYVSRDTGTIYWISEIDPLEEEVPDRGAYARFKELLASEGCLDKWYAFEAKSTAQALKNWCTENEIEIIENEEPEQPGT